MPGRMSSLFEKLLKTARAVPHGGARWYEDDPANACDYLAANVKTVFQEDREIMKFCSDNMLNSALILNTKGIKPQLAMDLTHSADWLSGLFKSTQKPDFQLTPSHAVYLRKAAWLIRDYENAMGKDNIVYSDNDTPG